LNNTHYEGSTRVARWTKLSGILGRPDLKNHLFVKRTLCSTFRKGRETVWNSMTHFIPFLTQECEGNSSRVRVVSDENKTLCHHILNCTLSEFECCLRCIEKHLKSVTQKDNNCLNMHALRVKFKASVDSMFRLWKIIWISSTILNKSHFSASRTKRSDAKSYAKPNKIDVPAANGLFLAAETFFNFSLLRFHLNGHVLDFTRKCHLPQ